MRKYLLIGALALMGIFAFSLFGKTGLINFYRVEKKSHKLELRLAELKAENQRLREQIEKLQTDPEYLEKVAREELGMVKPDELVFQLTEPAQP